MRFSVGMVRRVNASRQALAAPFWGRLREPESHVRGSVAVVLGGTLESDYNLARTAKAVFPLERSCPTTSMAPVLAITWMVAGIVLGKGKGPTPMERV